ncbi:hypothetical protein Q4519_13800 [Motilimonas sp. 1_MG-2023]|uniref:hypothetical protein n=1 Tax=Motilimonas sp. 1_MG-2023 TaxID=3062672 RepID=UPI0026E27C30|nr:hypothetical protein [Motilimonas sp. 1_MG-2023]MDO6526760.1 hypothetical protein [Motilimonas sp. 1_MG-2023]
MDREEFRKRFYDYLGDSVRYRKFVAQLNKSTKNRLAYWQQKNVVTFSNEHGLEVPEFFELRDIFNVCEVHGDELLEGLVKVFRGHVDYSREYEQATIAYFPNSYMNEINGPTELHGKSIAIKYCPACRVACEEWQRENA